MILILIIVTVELGPNVDVKSKPKYKYTKVMFSVISNEDNREEEQNN